MEVTDLALEIEIQPHLAEFVTYIKLRLGKLFPTDVKFWHLFEQTELWLVQKAVPNSSKDSCLFGSPTRIRASSGAQKEKNLH